MGGKELEKEEVGREMKERILSEEGKGKIKLIIKQRKKLEFEWKYADDEMQD